MNNHAGTKTTKRTSVFDKRQVIGLHRAGKYAGEVPRMMSIGYRTVQRTIVQWKKYGKVQSYSGNSGRAKILNTRYRHSLKRLVKANRQKSAQQLTSMFNEGPKKMSAQTMRRELKEMGLRSCVSTRKPGCDKLFGRVVYNYSVKFACHLKWF